ncbi:MAG: MFS transporter, partial [Chloroflexi bacterium]|nr:MFS transporter [Chloroflexota bacterium]
MRASPRCCSSRPMRPAAPPTRTRRASTRPRKPSPCRACEEAMMASLPSPETRTLSALWRAVFLVSFPFGILAFLLPIYGRELGASALEVGAFFSAFSIVPVVVRPLLGRALDRWGRRPFLLAGLAGYLAAVTVFGLASSVWMLTAARFVQGIGSSFLWLTAYTMIADLAGSGGRGLN